MVIQPFFCGEVYFIINLSSIYHGAVMVSGVEPRTTNHWCVSANSICIIVDYQSVTLKLR